MGGFAAAQPVPNATDAEIQRIKDALTAHFTKVNSPEISECEVCEKIVGYALGKIEKYGCGIITDAFATAACEAIGLGPEDPLADLCVAVIAEGCPEILKLIQEGIGAPSAICGDLNYC